MSSKRPSRAPLADSVFPPKVTPPADDASMRMMPLFERGKAALSAYVAALPYGQPLGWDQFGEKVLSPLRAITAADHDENPALVRKYVCATKAQVWILCEDGHLCTVHEARERVHW